MNLRELGDVIVRNHLSDHRGIIENTRFLALSEHLVQITFIHLQSISLQHRRMQGWRFLLADRRQLRLVTYQQQAVVTSLIHEMHQVIQQASASEAHPSQSHIGYHRRLIYHEKRIGIEIIIQIKLSLYPRKRFFTIDTAMDGIGRRTAVQREYLRSPTRRCQKHHLLTNLLQGPDDGTRERCLTRTRTTSQNHHGVRISIGKKLSKHLQGMCLFLGWRKAKLLQYLIF